MIAKRILDIVMAHLVMGYKIDTGLIRSIQRDLKEELKTLDPVLLWLAGRPNAWVYVVVFAFLFIMAGRYLGHLTFFMQTMIDVQ